MPEKEIPSLGTPYRPQFQGRFEPPRFGGLVILLQIIDGAVLVRE
jgi:hypothetical protein